MRKTALNVIMGMILAGSAAIAYVSVTPSETAGWTVAAISDGVSEKYAIAADPANINPIITFNAVFLISIF